MKTLKSNFLLLLAITTFTVAIIGCKKENNSNNLNKNSTSYNLKNFSRESGECEVLTDEQIDSIGVLHNELLETVLANFDYSSVNSGDMFTIARTSFINTDYKSASTEFKTSTFDSAYSWKNQTILSGNVELYMNDIKTELESDHNFSQISSFLSTLKSEVNSNSDLTTCEKQYIKIGISVALNSAEYWLPTEYGGNGLGYAHLVRLSQEQGNGTPTLPVARSKAGNIAGADAIGGAVNGIEYSLWAVFGGPVGVAGYVGTILFGAASSSLVAWAMS